MLICYHHDDLDGKSSAFIVHKFHPSSVEETTDSYVECKAGACIFNSHKLNDDVVIVDLSIAENVFDKLINLCKTARSVTWIDHHQTSQDLVNNHLDELQKIENLTYFISNSLCGAALAYVYFNLPHNYLSNIRGTVEDEYYDIEVEYNDPPEAKVKLFRYNKKNKADCTWFAYDIKLPKWLYHVDDYDCWKKIDRDTDNFVLGLSSPNLDIVQYDEHIGQKCFKTTPFDVMMMDQDDNDHHLLSYIKQGIIINGYIRKRYQDEMSDTFEWEYEGIKFLCKNATGNSWNFGEKIHQYPAVILFNYSGSSGKWEYSVYASDKSKFDCKAFCEKFGGGGHLRAAGFKTEYLIFTHREPPKKENIISVRTNKNNPWLKDLISEAKKIDVRKNITMFYEVGDDEIDLIQKSKINLFIVTPYDYNNNPHLFAEIINTCTKSDVYVAFYVIDLGLSTDAAAEFNSIGKIVESFGGKYKFYHSSDSRMDYIIKDVVDLI